MNRPWMKLYIGDYLADTGNLNCTQHGAYLLLIMHYWRCGGLPTDEGELARICRMTPAEWRKHRERLASFFKEGWRHARIDRELAEAEENHQRRVKAGQRGGRPPLSEKQCFPNGAVSRKQCFSGKKAMHKLSESESDRFLAKKEPERGEVSAGGGLRLVRGGPAEYNPDEPFGAAS